MKKIAAIIICVLLISTNAQALDVGVGLKAGTVGNGVEVSIALTKDGQCQVQLDQS